MQVSDAVTASKPPDLLALRQCKPSSQAQAGLSTIDVISPPPSASSRRTLRGNDEDLIVLNADNTWQMSFDGSDVALTKSTENVWGAWIDPRSGDRFLTTKDEYSVPGFPVNPLGGDQEEIIRFTGTTGPATAGTFSFFWNGDDNRFAGERLDGISIEFLNDPPVLGAAAKRFEGFAATTNPEMFAMVQNYPNPFVYQPRAVGLTTDSQGGFSVP